MFTMVQRGIRERGATGATRAGGRVHMKAGVGDKGNRRQGQQGEGAESKVEKWIGATECGQGRGNNGKRRQGQQGEKGNRQMDKRAGAIG
jgi:hypothetical protein